jgi:hypothetical protein
VGWAATATLPAGPTTDLPTPGRKPILNRSKSSSESDLLPGLPGLAGLARLVPLEFGGGVASLTAPVGTPSLPRVAMSTIQSPVTTATARMAKIASRNGRSAVAAATARPSTRGAREGRGSGSGISTRVCRSSIPRASSGVRCGNNARSRGCGSIVSRMAPFRPPGGGRPGCAHPRHSSRSGTQQSAHTKRLQPVQKENRGEPAVAADPQRSQMSGVNGACMGVADRATNYGIAWRRCHGRLAGGRAAFVRRPGAAPPVRWPWRSPRR